jgi:hypothetical protein
VFSAPLPPIHFVAARFFETENVTNKPQSILGSDGVRFFSRTDGELGVKEQRATFDGVEED